MKPPTAGQLCAWTRTARLWDFTGYHSIESIASRQIRKCSSGQIKKMERVLAADLRPSCLQTDTKIFSCYTNTSNLLEHNHASLARTMSDHERPSAPECEADNLRTVSWVHVGDLHMTRPGEQNEIDFGRIVDDINQLFTRDVQFVYLPGDIADDGSTAAYEAVAYHLKRLHLSWTGIVGDHDVHERAFDNFRYYIDDKLYGRFCFGQYRFLRLNAFSEARPDVFAVCDEQLTWLEEQLKSCKREQTKAVLLLHCYPTDLEENKGRKKIRQLLKEYPVLLVDMGHTHYNEISNDGTLLYSTTRSTGQIEEGPVGYSVITLDGNSVSWNFVQPGSPGLVDITAPIDYRLQTSRSGIKSYRQDEHIPVRAKIWSRNGIEEVKATFGVSTEDLQYKDGLWTGTIPAAGISQGIHRLFVTATDSHGQAIVGSSDIQVGCSNTRPEPCPVDQRNAIGMWRERGILGTQLGPNKNGRKW